MLGPPLDLEMVAIRGEVSDKSPLEASGGYGDFRSSALQVQNNSCVHSGFRLSRRRQVQEQTGFKEGILSSLCSGRCTFFQQERMFSISCALCIDTCATYSGIVINADKKLL